MSENSESVRLQRILPVVAGLVLISAAFVLDVALAGSSLPASCGVIVGVLGSVLIVLGIVVKPVSGRRWLAKVALSILSIVFIFGVSEVFFRAIHFDFAPSNPEIPIFNRPPSFHIGGGVLRRPGPAVWRGKPLSSLIHFSWRKENAYPDEEAIEIQYDRQGFRNPADLTDWDVAVTGDSFVESGYLPYESIFTTLAARRLGIRIKNLGVSGTGPVFQTAYLEKFGGAPSAKHAVLCFFEGNDMSDLVREVHDTNFISRTGFRMGRQKQTSLVIALSNRTRRLRPHPRMMN